VLLEPVADLILHGVDAICDSELTPVPFSSPSLVRPRRARTASFRS
jgi:hypothetical protein